jgi:hypothetical protein
MTRKADPPSRRPSRRKPSGRSSSQRVAPQLPNAAKAPASDASQDCDFGLAFSVVPALKRRSDA